MEVGKEYISRVGNLVKVIEREEIENAPGTFAYKGHCSKAVKGHEALEGKIQSFSEDGSWVAYPGGVHDLVREREKA